VGEKKVSGKTTGSYQKWAGEVPVAALGGKRGKRASEGRRNEVAGRKRSGLHSVLGGRGRGKQK